MMRLLIAVAVMIGLLAVLLAVAQVDPGKAGSALLQGNFGSPRAVTNLLRQTTPLLVAGVAVFVALRAGLFNIGVEGQLLVAATASAATGLSVPGPAGVLAALVAGVAAGALWALPAAALRAYRGGHEVISTIMLNSLALLLTDALVAGPLKQRSGAMASTDLLSPTTRLGSFPLGPVPVNLGLLLGVVLVAGAAAFFRRTTTGYEWQATGANPTAASYAAVDVAHNRFWALTLSGGIAGVAGAIEVLAFEGRFYQGFSGGVGFDALGVALLAGSTAWAVIPAAFLFGALANGGAAMQLAAQVPKELTTILLGLVILIAAAIRYRKVSEHG